MWTIAAAYQLGLTAQVSRLGLRLAAIPALSLNSSNEPGELSQGHWS